MSKILAFVVAGDEIYGISRFTASVIEQWVRSGIRCEVFALCDGPMAQLCAASGAYVECQGITPPPFYGRSGLEALGAILRLTSKSVQGGLRISAWLRRIRPDAVIVRSPNIVPMTSAAARAAGVPSFWIMPNEISDRYPFDLNKHIYDLLFFVTGMMPIANSKFTKSTLLNRRVEAKFLHLGVDGRAFDPNHVKATDRCIYGLSERDAVAGVFARVTPEKGQLELIQSMALHRNELSDLHLVICGGPMESEFGRRLKSSANELGLGKRVHFPGPQTDVRELNLMCDFVINSRLTPEPFGLSVIEGMMLGRPVLAHRAGGPGETIIDGQTGWLIDDPSSEGFAAGFGRALRDRGKWRDMGARARVHAVSHFDISIMADRLLCLFGVAVKPPSKSVAARLQNSRRPSSSE